MQPMRPKEVSKMKGIWTGCVFTATAFGILQNKQSLKKLNSCFIFYDNQTKYIHNCKKNIKQNIFVDLQAI